LFNSWVQNSFHAAVARETEKTESGWRLKSTTLTQLMPHAHTLRFLNTHLPRLTICARFFPPHTVQHCARSTSRPPSHLFPF